MRRLWNIYKPSRVLENKLSKDLSISPILARILVKRGMIDSRQAKEFLTPDINKLYSPFTLPDMEKAVERIKKAIGASENMLIFSDYDVDGITSCAVLKRALLTMSARIFHYFPHRIKEGYGLNKNIVKFCLARNITLLIALDCGTSDRKIINILSEKGIDVIVVDHHLPVEESIAHPFCLINPKISTSIYKFKDLAAVGLSFKLAQALTGKQLWDDLDLVCLGTVADVVPLLGENRIIVKEGLSRLQCTQKLGLQALIKVSSIKTDSIAPFHIGFILAPRLNAAGRIDSAEIAFMLLMSQSYDEAVRYATLLNQHNRKRQNIESDVYKQAVESIERNFDFDKDRVIVLHQKGWHLGVTGIVASKIADRYYRPTIIISFENGLGRGSARSIDSFHILDSLKKCSKLLKDFGGHRRAAGLSIEESKINLFNQEINSFARKVITEFDLCRNIEIDSHLDFDSIDENLLKELKWLAPFGEGNPEPKFCTRSLCLKASPRVLAKETLKLWLTDNIKVLPAIGFGMSSFLSTVKNAKQIDLIYGISKDTWQGQDSIILKIKDLRSSLV
ncbi:MAG: single-stranded-DNA-specific exonuclease RecJ [Candidatus Gygaella obscura]|nr:single-stranded-DNA-specific exonuclease RecJ [Candidatus Gygaella obscura]